MNICNKTEASLFPLQTMLSYDVLFFKLHVMKQIQNYFNIYVILCLDI